LDHPGLVTATIDGDPLRPLTELRTIVA